MLKNDLLFEKSWKHLRSVGGSAPQSIVGLRRLEALLQTLRVVTLIPVPVTFLSVLAALTCILSKKNKLSSNSKPSTFAPISLQILQFLLMGAQKYFCPRTQGTLATTPFAKFWKLRVRIELKLYCCLLLFF